MESREAFDRHLRTLNLVCGGIASGVAVFAVVAVWLSASGTVSEPALPFPVGAVLLLSGLGLLLAGHVAQVRLAEPPRDAGFDEVLEAHRKGVIVGFALREAAGILGGVAVLLGGSTAPGLGLAGLSVLAMLLAWPRREELRNRVSRPAS